MTALGSLNKARLVDAACRSYFASFTRKCFHTLNPGAVFRPNWHIRALAYHLEQVRLGKIKRLAISMPPRYAKSLMSSIAFPAFVLGHDPTKRVIAVSYAAELAIKHSNDFRELINASWYARLFPAMQILKNTETEVSSTQRGYRLATSIDGTLTGRGGDILIIDDYLKPLDALSDSKRAMANNWFFNTALSRLDDKQNGAVVIVGHRLHPDDLIGTLIRSSDAWITLTLPAIAEEDETIKIGDGQVHNRHAGEVIHPERDPIDVFEEFRSQIGAATFAAHYQQCPIPPGGLMIQRSWLGSYAQLPTPTSSSMYFQSWDTAVKPGESNAWSVCTTWLFHEGKYYLVDVLRLQVLYPTLREHAIAHAKLHKPANILIEDTAMGCELIPELKNAGFAVTAVRPDGDKGTRMAIQSAKFQRGQVLFPGRASWLVDVETELLAFPGGRHDDIVDTISQALAYEPTGYDLAKIADGMERLYSGLVFEQWCRRK